MVDNIGQAQTVQVPNYSGVNIQIFNPSVAAPGANVPSSNVNAQNYSTNPVYPPNYYTQNLAQPTPVQPVQETGKKKQKKEIVQITDDYVKELEEHLNNQDKKARLAAAKQVYARLEEDNSRKNDPALNALLNKMLQDPYQPVKFLAMNLIDQGMASGNSNSSPLLQKIQRQRTPDQQDELLATSALLKMSAITTDKEFETQDNKKNKGENK